MRRIYSDNRLILIPLKIVEESSVYGCPSAPNDPHLPIADAFLGYKDNYQRLLLLEKAVPNPKRNPDEDLKRIMTPSVHKNIRGQSDGVNVFPDDFVNNRKRAMKAVVSSRYNHFRYNYGGYVPFDIDEKRKLDATSFGLNDYKKHLNVRRCDFIAELLLGEDKKDSVMAETKKRLEEENARNRMLEAQREEEARLEKIQYKKGEWNTHVLNYMSEVCGNKSEGDSNELGKAKECEGSILVGIDDEPFLPNIANDGCPTLETTESGGACPKIETPESGEADTKIHEIEPPKILYFSLRKTICYISFLPLQRRERTST